VLDATAVDHAVFIGQHVQALTNAQELSGLEQKVRVAGPSQVLLPIGKGLVDQPTTRRDAAHKEGK
jgi:hypothetical protein